MADTPDSWTHVRIWQEMRRAGCPIWGAMLFVFALLPACDFLVPQRQAPPIDQYVVESYQIAGERMKPVRLMETAAAADTFETSERGVTGALVEIERLGADGGVVARYTLAENRNTAPGVYIPVDTAATIAPRGTYRLRVVPPGEERVLTARTTVPDTFRIISSSPDTVTYGASDAIALRATRSVNPNRQSYYLITSSTEDVRADRLTPAGHDLIEGTQSLTDIGRDRYTLRSLKRNEWGITNESSYPHHEDGTLSIQFPWVSVMFYGENRLDIYVIDNNLYDFIRSANAQKGGPTPGQTPNVKDHVEGGTGVFGSMATAEYRVVVRSASPVVANGSR